MIKICISLCLLLFSGIHQAYAFSFSEYEEAEEEKEYMQRQMVRERNQRNLRTHCPEKVKASRIMVVVSELHNGKHRYAISRKYHVLFEEINSRLRRTGFKTYTPKEIQDHIADAEQKAYLNNDLDAAVNAASELGADYILKAHITTLSQRNPIINVNEVFVNMDFSLQSATGAAISHTSAKGDSFAGADIVSVALKLTRERANSIVAYLYKNLCNYATEHEGK